MFRLICKHLEHINYYILFCVLVDFLHLLASNGISHRKKGQEVLEVALVSIYRLCVFLGSGKQQSVCTCCIDLVLATGLYYYGLLVHHVNESFNQSTSVEYGRFLRMFNDTYSVAK